MLAVGADRRLALPSRGAHDDNNNDNDSADRTDSCGSCDPNSVSPSAGRRWSSLAGRRGRGSAKRRRGLVLVGSSQWRLDRRRLARPHAAPRWCTREHAAHSVRRSDALAAGEAREALHAGVDRQIPRLWTARSKRFERRVSTAYWAVDAKDGVSEDLNERGRSRRG